MDGDKGINTVFVCFGLTILFGVLLFSPIGLTSAEEPTSTSTLIDGRIAGFQAEPSESHVREWSMAEGEWFSLVLDCNQCEAQVTLDGIITTSTTKLSLQATSNGTAELSIASTIEEYVSYSLVEVISENFEHVRPSPSESITLDALGYCNEVLSCINPTMGHLNGIQNGEYDESGFIRGVLEQSTPDFIPIKVAAGDSLELQFMHATNEISLSVYFQDANSETHLNQTIDQPVALVANTPGEAKIWHFNDDGRVLLKVESEGVDTAWVLKRMLHQQSDSNVFIQDHQDLKIVGHFSTSVTIELNDTQKMSLQPIHSSPTVRIDQLVGETWIDGLTTNTSMEDTTVIYPYPNVIAVRVHVESPVHWVSIDVSDFSDLQSGEEAPSYRPSSSTSKNSSWPHMPKQSAQLEGELTLSIHDTADVYRIEIEGWEESEHMIQIIVEGNSIEVLKLELWSMDQETWSDVESRAAKLANGKIQLAIEVSEGTHFFRVSLLDDTNYTQHDWGQDVPSLTYSLSSSYTLIDEGDEPYFPPDENAEKWGVRARFFLGALFLVPVAYLGILQYRTKKTAQDLFSKSEQLAWFKQQMDSGERTPQQSRKSLSKALQAISLLNWEEANKAWGKADLEYRTENVALAVWKLDGRMVKNEGSIPLMVGVHILEGNWDLAALRFDAPVGQGWEVKHVEPRFLHRGEEVFLDTMAVGNRTFIMAELMGDAGVVDIELNGRMDGEASAARIPSTLVLGQREEE